MRRQKTKGYDHSFRIPRGKQIVIKKFYKQYHFDMQKGCQKREREIEREREDIENAEYRRIKQRRLRAEEKIQNRADI